MKIIFVVFSICLFTDLKGQDVNFCELYKSIYYKDLQHRYRFQFASDSIILFKPNTQEDFVKHFRRYLSRKKLKSVYNQGKIEYAASKEFNCMPDSLIGTKHQLFQHLNKIDPSEFIKDSSFVMYVNQQHDKISKIQNEEERFRQLNVLTQSLEFQKYSIALNYFTPRIIEYSYPVFYNDYVFVQVNATNRHRDIVFCIIYLMKGSGAEWQIITKKDFVL